MPTDYGRLLPSGEAKIILDYFGILPDTDLGYSMMPVKYSGVDYWIAQNETRFPAPTSSSPDGWHIVYSPSQEEIDVSKPPASFDFASLLTLGAVAIGAYLLVNVLQSLRSFNR